MSFAVSPYLSAQYTGSPSYYYISASGPCISVENAYTGVAVPDG